MMHKPLAVLLFSAFMIGNAHAEAAVEHEIWRSVNDPCQSKLEYRATAPEEHHVSCPGCTALALRGSDQARGWMEYFNAIASSGAPKSRRMMFMSVMHAVENAAVRRLKTGHAGPVSFAQKAREIGLCR